MSSLEFMNSPGENSALIETDKHSRGVSEAKGRLPGRENEREGRKLSAKDTEFPPGRR
jgi:hypothetical protein